jgi:CheY-like chemotaxis protein
MAPGPQILLVEDEPYFLRPFVRCLEREGFSVECAESAAEVAERLREGVSYALGIVDLNLPSGPRDIAGVDEDVSNLDMGWRAIEIIREAGGPSAGMPIIVLSAYADLSDRVRSEEETRKLGVCAVIHKQAVTPRRLLEAVQACL